MTWYRHFSMARTEAGAWKDFLHGSDLKLGLLAVAEVSDPEKRSGDPQDGWQTHGNCWENTESV